MKRPFRDLRIAGRVGTKAAYPGVGLKEPEKVSGGRPMNPVTAINNRYQVFYKKLRALYRTYSTRKWATRHSAGKTLTAAQKKEIREYYRPYHSVSTLFHEYYTEKTGVYAVNYLPNDLYINYIDSFYNDAKKAVVLENKCYFQKMFPDVKQPEMVCYRLNRFWYTPAGERVGFAEIEKAVASEKTVVVKQAAGSSGGHAVSFLDNNSEHYLADFASTVAAIPDDIVVQRPIVQHEKLSALNSSSVNSLRIVSLLRKDDVKVYSVVLRMGVAGMRVDNESSGGINCGVREDGTLRWEKNAAYAPCELIEKSPEDYPQLGISRGESVYSQFVRDNDRFLWVARPALKEKEWKKFVP